MNECQSLKHFLSSSQANNPETINSLPLTCSSLSLLVNILSPRSLDSPLALNISFSSYVDVDPLLTFAGFPGRAARFQAAKQTLDLQVYTQPTHTHHAGHSLLLPPSVGQRHRVPGGLPITANGHRDWRTHHLLPLLLLLPPPQVWRLCLSCS